MILYETQPYLHMCKCPRRIPVSNWTLTKRCHVNISHKLLNPEYKPIQFMNVYFMGYIGGYLLLLYQSNKTRLMSGKPNLIFQFTSRLQLQRKLMQSIWKISSKVPITIRRQVSLKFLVSFSSSILKCNGMFSCNIMIESSRIIICCHNLETNILHWPHFNFMSMVFVLSILQD